MSEFGSLYYYYCEDISINSNHFIP